MSRGGYKKGSMRYLVAIMCLVVVFSGASVFAASVVEIKTNYGTIVVQLHDDKAPVSVDNFLKYVDQNFYDGTIFHRIIPGFMIQGGGFDQNDRRKPTDSPIVNEAANGLKNRAGTLAMARTNVVDSATSQFFINLVDNDFLDHRGSAPGVYGYAVFGQVVEGMDVVEKIGAVRTYTRSNHFQDYPQSPVVVETIRRATPK